MDQLWVEILLLLVFLLLLFLLLFFCESLKFASPGLGIKIQNSKCSSSSFLLLLLFLLVLVLASFVSPEGGISIIKIPNLKCSIMLIEPSLSLSTGLISILMMIMIMMMIDDCRST